MSDVFKRLEDCRIVPVVKLPSADAAEGLGRALLAARVPCVEVTLRSDAALRSLEILSRMPELLVGAGTIRSVEQARAAEQAGARFLVSPGLREDVLRHAAQAHIPLIPGVCTPTEIEHALDLGATVLKFFPAEPMGGVAALKALGAVYSDVRFMPTGGVNADNLVSYLSLDNVACCGGSWLAETKLLAEGRFDEIERRSRHAVAIAASAKESSAEKSSSPAAR